MKHKKILFVFFCGLFLVLMLPLMGQAASPQSAAINLTVYGTPIGVSTRYIGACEGNVDFDIADMKDLGLNTYRIYGGMSRWEPQDDDGVYGLPTVDQIKGNPDVIPWDVWDQAMMNPSGGTDYHWAGFPAEESWQGSAYTLFSQLKEAGIRPVVSIRNTDPAAQPDWALQLNPPRTEEDWNEWWEHVFATVYWLNVRNDLHVDEFEIHNEPDYRRQGWGGNQADYFNLVTVAADAIRYVYDTYLPERTYHIHAPVAVAGSHWIPDALAEIPTDFDSVNYHDYAEDLSVQAQQVHQWMKESSHSQSPLWLGEWGTYNTGYEDFRFSLNLIRNMLRTSQPGDGYIYGSHIFSLYDWGRKDGFVGLVSAEGDRRPSYYAFRMGIRALQGGRPVFLTTTSSTEVMAMTTQDEQQHVYVLLVNNSAEPQVVQAHVSSLVRQGTAMLWEFSEQVQDEVIDEKTVTDGTVTMEMPAYASQLVMIQGA